ncbi:MAG: hypothetical protein ACRD68_05225 [Pyrinomonadaceae bacterium]
MMFGIVFYYALADLLYTTLTLFGSRHDGAVDGHSSPPIGGMRTSNYDGRVASEEATRPFIIIGAYDYR